MELLGYAQPCVAHAGETVDVKVSTTQTGFTAEVVRLGLTAEAAVPQVADGHFPGRQQDLISGSYLVADLGDEPAGYGHSVQFWFFPTLLAGRQCLMAGFGADWRLGGGRRVEGRLSFARLSAAGDVLGSVRPGRIQAGRWYFAVASWDGLAMVTLVAAARARAARRGPGRRRPSRSRRPAGRGPGDCVGARS